MALLSGGEERAVSQPGEQVVGESGNAEQRILYLHPHSRSLNRLCAWCLASLTMVKAMRVRPVVYTVCHAGRGEGHQ